MTAGETVFTTEGLAPKRFETKPLPIADYDLKLVGTKAEVRMSQTSGVPYVSVPFAAVGTAKEGGRDRLVYHMFFLSLKPGKDGIPMTYREDQIIGFKAAAGVELTLPVRPIQANNKGTLETVTILDPQALVKWLQEQDGLIVSGHVKIEKGRDGYDDRNKIARFNAPETNESGGNVFND